MGLLNERSRVRSQAEHVGVMKGQRTSNAFMPQQYKSVDP